jgi:hypothetical protein
MSRYQSPLDNIRIASPCSADWNEMYGNDRMRHCGDCKLNVYNLSGMSRDEAENLVMNAEGRLCVRFYRRPDGTIITENCPVGWAKVKARAKVYVTAAFSLVMAMLGSLFIVSLLSRKTVPAEVGVLAAKPTPTPTPKVRMTMGAVANNTNTEVKGDVDQRWTMGNFAAPQQVTRNGKIR